MYKLIENSYKAKNIRDRVISVSLLIAVPVLVGFGIFKGWEEIQDRIYYAGETAKIEGKQFCIFRYELDWEPISDVDRNINDGCSTIIKFDDSHVYLSFRKQNIKAEYKYIGYQEVKFYNADHMGQLFNSNFGLSVTSKGINIIGDRLKILAVNME